ncbi:MAG TPA: hypothetical protein VGM19_13120 [Armatimonadota bacterium]
MADDLEDFEGLTTVRTRRLSWGSVAGAAAGLVLGIIGYKWGLGAVIVCTLLALIGGWAGRYWIGD